MADTDPAGQHDSRLRPTEYPGNCPQILDPCAFGPAGRARPDFETRDFGHRRHLPKEFAEPLGFVHKLAIAGERICRQFRSEAHTSEPQSPMRISTAVLCLK